MRGGVRQLGAVVGLKVRQQVQLAAVEPPVARPTQRNHTVGWSQPPVARATKWAGSTGFTPQTMQTEPRTFARCACDAPW